MLDWDGQRCPNTAIEIREVHFDPDIEIDGWARINVCKRCDGLFQSKQQLASIEK